MCACEEVLTCTEYTEACFECVCIGAWWLFFTLAGEAVNVEVCVFDAHHLPTAHLATALAHDGRISTAGERRAAVVVSSVKTRLVLN